MVSGGQDSVALLHLLATGAYGKAGPESILALHINHHLRGAESEADQALVERLCASLEVPLMVSHQPVRKHGNVQETAREARRQAALRVAGEQGMSRIVLAHTADDQVETMLYRLGRYGGLAAFRAMLPCDPPWVRPLLACRRAQTAAYCEAMGLEFAEDRGNRDPGYARTAIREQVMPAWEAGLPGAVTAAARTAEVAAEMERLVAGMIAAFMEKVTEEGVGRGPAGPDALSVASLLGLEKALRRVLLHAWLEGRARPAASRASVLAVEELLLVPGSGERALGGGWKARKAYDRLWLEKARGDGGLKGAGEGARAVRLPVPGSVSWEGWRIQATLLSKVEPERYWQAESTREAFLDARSLEGEVVVRGPRPGDRVRPLGARGSRKLQDILVDCKVPRGARSRVPLVVAEGKIVWVGGLLMAEEGRITPDTRQVVWLQLFQDSLDNEVT